MEMDPAEAAWWLDELKRLEQARADAARRATREAAGRR